MEDVLILSEDKKTVRWIKDINVKEIVIPEGVIKIEDCAFRDCIILAKHRHPE